MKPSLKRRVGGAGLLAVVVAGFAAATIGTGSAPAASSGSGAKASGVMRVRVDLTRFQADQKHHRLVAHCNVVTTYLSGGKVRVTSTKRVAMRVQQGTTCRVLHLELGELHLSLLGLIVNLTPVDDPTIVLDISADSSEALGKLLCQVINAVQGTTVAKTTAATKRLNAVVKKRYSGGKLVQYSFLPALINNNAARLQGVVAELTPLGARYNSLARSLGARVCAENPAPRG